jgi:signal transduction histidine kinase
MRRREVIGRVARVWSQILGGVDNQEAASQTRSATGARLAADVGLGLLVSGLWFLTFAIGRAQGWRPQDPGTWVVAGICLGLAVAVRRIAGAWLIVALALAYPLVYFQPLVSYFHLLPLLVLAFAGAQLRIRRIWVVAVVIACVVGVGLLFSPLVDDGPGDPGGLFGAFTGSERRAPDGFGTAPRQQVRINWSSFAWAEFATISVALLGAAIASQRATARDLAARNEELERLRRSEADRAVAEERLRISREVHDVVAHHLTAILMRAQAADRVGDAHPDEARSAVAWIAEEARDALRSTRVTVSSLRDAAPVTGGADDGPLAADLVQIVERVRQVGLRTQLSFRWEAEPALAPPVGLAVRRTVQEALTNVLKHAKTTDALVALEPDEGGLSIWIVDDGAGPGGSADAPHPAIPGSGAGLAGMRERSATCGGRLRYGANVDGGWQVHLWVPVLAGGER